MRNTPLTSPPEIVLLRVLKVQVESWLLDCEISQHSISTLALRRHVTSKLLWFLHDQELEECGHFELRKFLRYVGSGHTDTRGRWGNPNERSPATPGTVATFHRQLRAFFNWIVREGILASSPMERVSSVVDRPDEIQPFTISEIEGLRQAARNTPYKERDQAIVAGLGNGQCTRLNPGWSRLAKR
jgi:site-specific recombinase XerD